jgi:hypothetical protein
VDIIALREILILIFFLLEKQTDITLHVAAIMAKGIAEVSSVIFHFKSSRIGRLFFEHSTLQQSPQE